MSRRSHRLSAAVALAAAAILASPPAEAKKKEKYYFFITSVNLAEGIPDHVQDRVRAQMLGEFRDNDAIITEFPAGTPDPDTAPKKFKRYIKKHKIRPFKIKVDVTEYSREVLPMPDGRRGKRLKVSIALRMFGETIPDRVMAFAGSGSASIQLEVGKKARPRDDEVAHADSFEPAVAEAVAESLRKMQMPAHKPGKKKRKKKKSKN